MFPLTDLFLYQVCIFICSFKIHFTVLNCFFCSIYLFIFSSNFVKRLNSLFGIYNNTPGYKSERVGSPL